MATVYLHIGTMKTGTSAIQRLLYYNNDVLEKYGYNYPDLNQGFPQNYIARNGHFLVWRSSNADEQKRREEELDFRKKYFDQIKKLSQKYSNIILSDEVIWRCSNHFPHYWEDLLEGFHKIDCEVKIIVYLRRQDLMIQSIWNQFVKANTFNSTDFMDVIRTDAFRGYPTYYA